MGKKWINNIDDLVASIALIGVIGITIANVFFRYVFNNPIPWGEEVTLGLYVWFVFVGTSSAMKKDGHIGVDYFVERMPYKIKMTMIAIRTIVIYFVLFYVFIYLGFDLTAQAQIKVTPSLQISYQWIDIAVPVGGILTLYHYSKSTVNTIKCKTPRKGGI